MARFLSHTLAARPRPNASSLISLQIAPRTEQLFRGDDKKQMCNASHPRGWAADCSNCRESIGKRLTTILTAVLKRLSDCGCDSKRCCMVDTDAKTAWQLFHLNWLPIAI